MGDQNHTNRNTLACTPWGAVWESQNFIGGGFGGRGSTPPPPHLFPYYQRHRFGAQDFPPAPLKLMEFPLTHFHRGWVGASNPPGVPVQPSPGGSGPRRAAPGLRRAAGAAGALPPSPRGVQCHAGGVSPGPLPGPGWGRPPASTDCGRTIGAEASTGSGAKRD